MDGKREFGGCREFDGEGDFGGVCGFDDHGLNLCVSLNLFEPKREGKV